MSRSISETNYLLQRLSVHFSKRNILIYGGLFCVINVLIALFVFRPHFMVKKNASKFSTQGLEVRSGTALDFLKRRSSNVTHLPREHEFVPTKLRKKSSRIYANPRKSRNQKRFKEGKWISTFEKDVMTTTKAIPFGTTKKFEGVTKPARGTTKMSDGTIKMSDGIMKMSGGTTMLSSGTREMSSGAKKLSDDTIMPSRTTKMSDGTIKMHDGTTTMSHGITKISTGNVKIFNGTTNISGGTTKTSNGTTKMSNRSRGNIKMFGTTKMSSGTTKQPSFPPTPERKTFCETNLNIHVQNSMDDIPASTCRPRVPSEESCIFTRANFPRDPSIIRCKDQAEAPREFCTLREEQNPEGGYAKLTAACDVSKCTSPQGMNVDVLDPNRGALQRVYISGAGGDVNRSVVEQTVLRLAERTREAGYPFLFVNCPRGNVTIQSQLITLLPPLPVITPTEVNKINLNIVLLDSISRRHFYRALPRTVDYLRRVQHRGLGEVFEYELFQAAHGHTIECERALFDGLIFPQNRTNKERDGAAINLDVLYGIFKRAGYQTLFLDDLCWKGVYGLRQKYRADSWQSLQAKLKQSPIDSTGFTDASCGILDRLKITTPFFATPNHQVCFNGKHHHDYLFDYLARYLDAIHASPRSKPLFAYTSTHVSHDNRGLRVQSLDKSLAEFLDTLTKKENTLSLLFADHGNTYTSYQSKHSEGRWEMYHPAMLAIVPKQVAGKLGEEVMRNLRTNQRRLFTLFDIRAGIIELAGYDGRSKLNPAGFFGHIAPNRSCEDIQMTPDSICICGGWEIAITNTTEQRALAEFAIGQLNNRIQDSLRASAKAVNATRGRVVFGACRRLRVQEFGNVRTRRMRGGVRTTTMDVRLQSEGFVTQREVITVQVAYKDKEEAAYMKLVSENRLSAYGSYRKCVDPDVDVRLCICKLAGTENRSQSLEDIVGKTAIITELNACVRGIQRTERNATFTTQTFEIANICTSQQFTATLSSLIRNNDYNIRYSTHMPVTIKIPAKTIYYVATVSIWAGTRNRPAAHWKIH